MGALLSWMLTLDPPPSPILFNCNHYYIQYETQMLHFPTQPFNLLSIVGSHGNDSRMQRALFEFLGSIFVSESRPCHANAMVQQCSAIQRLFIYPFFFGLSMCDIISISPLHLTPI